MAEVTNTIVTCQIFQQRDNLLQVALFSELKHEYYARSTKPKGHIHFSWSND